MKKTMNLLCGALALLCLVSLFIPIVAPKYPASEYHPGNGDYTKDYFLVGDYYIAREYWSLAKFALSSGFRIALSVACALLLYWATMSLMGEEALMAGIVAATVNLGVVAFWLELRLLRSMMASFGSIRVAPSRSRCGHVLLGHLRLTEYYPRNLKSP